jgi:hypothetical protein
LGSAGAEQAGSFGIAVVLVDWALVPVVFVDPGIGGGCCWGIAIPRYARRLGSDSLPQCLLCRGLDDQIAVAVATVGDSPWAVPGVGYGRPAVKRDRDCPRPARWTWADAGWTPAATAGDGGPLVAGSDTVDAALPAWGRFS